MYELTAHEPCTAPEFYTGCGLLAPADSPQDAAAWLNWNWPGQALRSGALDWPGQAADGPDTLR